MFDVARANYVGVFGTDAIKSPPDDGNGCFFQNSSLGLSAVTDGLSNTLMVGEHGSRAWPATWVGAVPGASRNMALVVGSANRVPNSVPNYDEDFGSFHPGGANFVFCDGSVKPISDEIDLIAFQALATRAGGE
jgi:prepilin-type processing-associated H-X9-DG protein